MADENTPTEPLTQAPALVRGIALAVDLSVAVACACAAFALLSLLMPLDNDSAKGPIAVIMLVAVLYIGIGRVSLPSLGRKLAHLRVVRIALPPPGRRRRSITTAINARAQPPSIGGVFIAIAAITAFTVTAMGISLVNTEAYRVARAYAESVHPLQTRYGAAPVLRSFPRALLIGKQRAFVQFEANWRGHTGLVDIHLVRDAKGWTAIAADEGRADMFADFSLLVDDAKIPKRPN